MGQEIFEQVKRAGAGDQEAMCFLIKKFDPLLRFAARSLAYEDAYEETVTEFIAAVRKLDPAVLRNRQDAGMICYFRTMVRNFIPMLAKRRRDAKRWICFSSLGEAGLQRAEMKQSTADHYPGLMCWELQKLLTQKEYAVIGLFFFGDVSIAGIAERLGITRQAVNQLKLQGLRRLRRTWEDKAV